MQFKYGQRFWRGVGVGGVAVVMALPATAAFGQTAIHHDATHDVIKANDMGKGDDYREIVPSKTKSAGPVRVTLRKPLSTFSKPTSNVSPPRTLTEIGPDTPVRI